MDDKAWTKLFVTGRSVSYPKDVIVRGVATTTCTCSMAVRVEKGDETHTAGQNAVLNLLDSGNTFGEMSFLDGSLPCANCIAEPEPVAGCSCRSRGSRRCSTPTPTCAPPSTSRLRST